MLWNNWAMSQKKLLRFQFYYGFVEATIHLVVLFLLVTQMFLTKINVWEAKVLGWYVDKMVSIAVLLTSLSWIVKTNSNMAILETDKMAIVSQRKG